MPDSLRPLSACAALALVSACAGGAAVPLPSAGARPAPQPAEPFRTPRPQPGGDIAGIMGADSRSLLARFGEPRIQAVEGDARKLQFASADCVLDIYLYPMREGGTPVATHVEARLRQGGVATSREDCIRAVESKR
ncbi:hypothetical protein Ga0102493_11883 [Erythrobacter litoralis]|uniref:Lipoprotein n=1 Tax=Erythrobacter litoralis TaxID=39960 RepID=A0A074MXJ4_9SPHN|nr:hypothetical protein [Erythrobacter litoralis]AOL25010.1 hypothetical protein Ga0102493_11883 [Erythrobacter litoralis]KEO96533.1 hypothetical protein EH32_09905 [Erythrobacter litoralis]MEE4337589.1 hypothetical protein [Erythrobacter sp.]